MAWSMEKRFSNLLEEIGWSGPTDAGVDFVFKAIQALPPGDVKDAMTLYYIDGEAEQGDSRFYHLLRYGRYALQIVVLFGKIAPDLLKRVTK